MKVRMVRDNAGLLAWMYGKDMINRVSTEDILYEILLELKKLNKKEVKNEL